MHSDQRVRASFVHHEFVHHKHAFDGVVVVDVQVGLPPTSRKWLKCFTTYMVSRFDRHGEGGSCSRHPALKVSRFPGLHLALFNPAGKTSSGDRLSPRYQSALSNKQLEQMCPTLQDTMAAERLS